MPFVPNDDSYFIQDGCSIQEGLGEIREDIGACDLMPTAATLAMNERRFSITSYSELLVLQSFLTLLLKEE